MTEQEKIREVERIVSPYIRGLWASLMVNKEEMSSNKMADHIESIEHELATAIVEAIKLDRVKLEESLIWCYNPDVIAKAISSNKDVITIDGGSHEQTE